MREEDCYHLGEVIKTHGLHGEVTISLDVDFPEDYKNLESILLRQKGKLIPFFVNHIAIRESKALLKLEDVDSIDAAKELVKSRVYLPLTQLPKLVEGQFYFHDLIGCEVFAKKEKIGVVTEVYDLNGNELLSVDSDGKEVLIPIKDEILQKVDLPNKKIIVDLPDGLIELYNS